jgi:Cu2+-exporting ATPase
MGHDTVTAAIPAPSPTGCLHCGSLLVDLRAAPFCCLGCQGAYEFLREARLDRYYALRDGPGRPVLRTRGFDHRWTEPLVAVIASADPVAKVDLDIQGLHCSACVWLIERIFTRLDGHASIVVNPAMGRMQLVVGAAFDLTAFVREVERFGYLLGPARKSERRASTDIVWRMGVCIAIAMNSMTFAFAMYAGLADGPVFVLFQRLNLALSTVSVVVGGPVFFRSAWHGVRRGIMHLDVPIALGILLAFAGSVASYRTGRTATSYVDTLNTFIALMLVGRWLRERVLERNRLEVLASDGADGLLTRRRSADVVATVPCTSIRAGEVLVISPGDLVPVDARLLGDRAESCSLDWINGENRPRSFAPGSIVPAGAFLAGGRVVEVEATSDFEGSALMDLLRTPVSRDADGAMLTPWWQQVTRYYVGAVLALATIGGIGWLAATHHTIRSLEVVTAILVVTCPCAFGLATPLAYALAQARLRRAGLFVRSAGFLDRAVDVRTVVFDKTGTLTAPGTALLDHEAIRRLPPEARSALRHLVERSNHPKTAALRSAMAELPLSTSGGALESPVTEWTGHGVEVTHAAKTYRLGAADWSAPTSGTATSDLVFAVDGRLLATFSVQETLRTDAAYEVAALRHEGYDVWLLSGDDPARVVEVARSCGLDATRAIGGASPRGKDDWLRAHDRGDVLMVGDGINDTLVVEHASCSGTPAVDRPFMAARSDFYFVTAGLSPVREALHAARAVARVRTMNLSIALCYNIVAVGLAFAGLMSPILCAVLMPLSSLTTLGATRAALSPASRLWKS